MYLSLLCEYVNNGYFQNTFDSPITIILQDNTNVTNTNSAAPASVSTSAVVLALCRVYWGSTVPLLVYLVYIVTKFSVFVQ